MICLAVSGSTVLFATSVTVTAMGGDQQLADPGSTFSCAQSNSSAASCSIAFTYFRGRVNGYADTMGTAAFGSLSGLAEGGGDHGGAPNMASYDTSFSDYVIVTGGTGNGTLISHYQLTAGGTAAQIGTSDYAPVPTKDTPSFYFVQGSERGSFTPYLTAADNSPGCRGYANACLAQTYDFSSPITFDSSLALGADTQAMLTDFPCSINGCLGDAGTGFSSLALTGYTVLDSAGNVVADPSVTEVGPNGFNFFVPEPSSVWLALLGLGAVVPALRRRGGVRTETSGPVVRFWGLRLW